jgi:hypothetical protein
MIPFAGPEEARGLKEEITAVGGPEVKEEAGRAGCKVAIEYGVGIDRIVAAQRSLWWRDWFE